MFRMEVGVSARLWLCCTKGGTHISRSTPVSGEMHLSIEPYRIVKLSPLFSPNSAVKYRGGP
jgi:hypothetical protein